MCGTHTIKVEKGLSLEKEGQKRGNEKAMGGGIKTNHICFLSHAGVLFEGRKEEQWEEQRKRNSNGDKMSN